MARFSSWPTRSDESPPGLHKKMPWRGLIAPGVVLCKDGHALLRTYAIRGIDAIGEDPETIGAQMLKANDALKRLDGAWTLHAEAQRTRIRDVARRTARFPVAGLIEADRLRTVLTDPGTRATRYYCTLTWTPGRGEHHALSAFYAATDSFMAHMRGLLAVLRPLTTEELLTYLKTTVSAHWSPVCEPVARTDLARYLCDSSWSAGSYPEWDAALGPWHVRVLTLCGYPAKSWATMMQQLEALDVDFRWSTRWRGIEKHMQDGILYQQQKNWLTQEKTVWQHTKELSFGAPQRIVNEDAIRKAEDVSAVRQELGADIYGIGQFSTTLLTWGHDAAHANRNATAIQHVLETLGFVAKREGSYGTQVPLTTWCLQYLAPPHHTAAFLSTVPGNTVDNIRRSLQTTMTLAHLMPGLRAVWPGPEQDEHLQEPPWFLAQTESSSLVRVCQFVRDIGHSVVFGSTGSGKSTMIGFAMAQWLMYRSTQGTIFDVGRSARLITLLLGGEWVDLGEGTMHMQPLRDIDHPDEFRWCLEWLGTICQNAKVPETHGMVHEYVTERLREVRLMAPDARTMRALLHVCEAHSRRVEPNAYKRRDVHGLAQPNERLLTRFDLYRAVQRALRPFCSSGEYGSVLDGVQPHMLDSHLVTFECGALVKTPRLLEAVSQYAFHLTERRFDTRRPMWLVMEEAPLLAAMPHFREQFDAWLLTIRKAGASLALVINSLQQAARLGTGLLTDDNTPTKWFFGNPQALTPQSGAVYDLFGLTHEEKRLIATARPYCDIYYSSTGHGKRMIQLPFSPFILDCIGRNSDEDHELIDKLLKEEGKENFAAAWFAEHGYEDAVTQLGRIPYATIPDAVGTQ